MPPVKSGYYYPNKFARIFLDAMEEVMGKNGLNAVLHLADLDNLIGNYPPDNLDKVFDFADFTALCVALEEMYGPRGGRGLARRRLRRRRESGLRRFLTAVFEIRISQLITEPDQPPHINHIAAQRFSRISNFVGSVSSHFGSVLVGPSRNYCLRYRMRCFRGISMSRSRFRWER